MTMMKSSNTEWLGDIPAEWDVAQIGNYYELRNEKVSDYDFEPLSVTMKGIVPQLATAAKSDDHSNRKLVKKGDFVINSRSDRRGSCGISPLDGSVSLINIVMEPRGEMNPQYYNWLFHTEQFADEFYKWGHGIVDDLWTTRWQEMKKILIVAPSPDEQQAIADYLDETCSKIDEIIAEAKASIDEYKELKQSVIFEAVTKGLDKNVKMKDSGIEWIGEIPVSWDCEKMRYIVNDIGDIDHYMPESVGHGIAYLMTGDLSDKVSNINFEKCKQVSYEDYKKLSKKIKAEIRDIIFARYASIGIVCYVDVDKNFLVSYSCVVIKPKHDIINSLYVKYYLQSKAFKEEVLRLANSNVQMNVGKESLLQAKITVPSLYEQERIVNFLDKRTAEIDSLISEKESLINDLEVYKKSLIYEVVTGKRRVV